MAASDNLHPEQLSMFMSAKDIRANYDAGSGDIEDQDWKDDKGYYYTAEYAEKRMWARKLDETKREGDHHGAGLYKSIARDGVRDPVGLRTYGVVLDGHHRIAAQYDIDPERLMPVKHWD